MHPEMAEEFNTEDDGKTKSWEEEQEDGEEELPHV